MREVANLCVALLLMCYGSIGVVGWWEKIGLEVLD